MSLTAEQLGYLNPNTNSHQWFEARWWVFPMSEMTVVGGMSAGQIDPDPIPIIQPRFGVLRSNETTIILYASDSYEWPSTSTYTAPAGGYVWSKHSGPGYIVGGTTSATCTVNVPVSDTPTVIKLVVTDSGASTGTAYGRYIRPATTDKGLAGSLRVSGSYTTGGWTADAMVMDDLTNVVSGSPLNNVMVIEIDRYWNGTMANFGSYSPRPSLFFVGLIEDFSQYEECGQYYTRLRCATVHEQLSRREQGPAMFCYHNSDFGPGYFYDADFRLVDIPWLIFTQNTDLPDYLANVYLWPEASYANGENRYGVIIAHDRHPIWHVLSDTLTFFGAYPYCTAQGDVICGPEPGLLGWIEPDGPLESRGKMFDSSGAGALTEDYLMARDISYRRDEVSQIYVSATRETYQDIESVGASAGTYTNTGRVKEMTGYLERTTGDEPAGSNGMDMLACDLLARLNRDYDIEIEGGMSPVWELGQFSDVDLDDEQQEGATSVLEIEDDFWVSDVSYNIDFNNMTWRTRAVLQQVTIGDYPEPGS